MVNLNLPALDRKLLRDLRAMKGQALAIAAVIAAGVSMFVAFLSNFDSLERTMESYYMRQRFADVFASAVRAPNGLADRIAEIPGVSAVDTRVVADVTLDVPDMTEAATGRLISIPAGGRPRLNDVVLRSGRMPEPSRPDEVLVVETFSEAHGFVPGDRVAAVINGRRRWLTMVGTVLSPEYVYNIRPGEIIADNRRFGIFWMERRALAAAFDMEGAFNDVSLDLAPGASVDEAIARLDRLLEPYGGLGAIPRAQQASAWQLEAEITQLGTLGLATPLIFLGVAAFILNVALTRALALQRGQIAALKALGYANRQLAWHYIKLALGIAAAGAIPGVLIGGWLGAAMIDLYNEFFRFPTLEYRLSAGVAIASVAASLFVAALGAQSAVRRAVSLAPAEAMRPEAPARFRRSIVERVRLFARLPHATRMVLRAMERQPVRAVMSIVGLAFAVAVLIIGTAMLDVIDVLIDDQFSKTMRQDVTVTFVEPRSADAIHALAHLPGVMEVEPTRVVPARLRAGHRHRALAISGLVAEPSLNRVLDRSGDAVRLPPEGLVLSTALGDILGVKAGDEVRVEVLEGARPTREVTVARLVDDSVGLQAYMEIGALRRLMREGATLTGAFMTVDASRLDEFHQTVKRVPAISGVAVSAATLDNFRELMAENTGLMVFINALFAGVIAFGVVYNSARVSLSERSRELASLRVLGFSRAEIAMMLVGELAILTVAALPIGVLLGYLLGQLMMMNLDSEVYRLPFVVSAQTVAWTFLTIVGATTVSALAVKRQLDRLDLVGVLKTRE